MGRNVWHFSLFSRHNLEISRHSLHGFTFKLLGVELGVLRHLVGGGRRTVAPFELFRVVVVVNIFVNLVLIKAEGGLPILFSWIQKRLISAKRELFLAKCHIIIQFTFRAWALFILIFGVQIHVFHVFRHSLSGVVNTFEI